MSVVWLGIIAGRGVEAAPAGRDDCFLAGAMANVLEMFFTGTRWRNSGVLKRRALAANIESD